MSTALPTCSHVGCDLAARYDDRGFSLVGQPFFAAYCPQHRPNLPVGDSEVEALRAALAAADKRAAELEAERDILLGNHHLAAHEHDLYLALDSITREVTALGAVDMMTALRLMATAYKNTPPWLTDRVRAAAEAWRALSRREREMWCGHLRVAVPGSGSVPADVLDTISPESEEPSPDPLHPCGRCTCASEGKCEWCRMTSEKENLP